MRKPSNWTAIIDKFKVRLSNWNASLLSISGCTTLIKSVLGNIGIYPLSLFRAPTKVIRTIESLRARFFWGGNLGTRKMAWVKWDLILASHEKGGLGIGSLNSFNLSLLLRWQWRLVNNPNALWVRVIKEIHGVHSGFSGRGCRTHRLWSDIVSSISSLHSQGVLTSNTLARCIGNGSSTQFWLDMWHGNTTLAVTYNRLFRLDANPNCLVADE
ncbi:uncharacterized mitochondrial protein AtMg00310-like [Rutidosis leptorrhynchoides]|uniref:uncharacterized mitochondrial protein AtMg00310-like n=1 Tax=Rutidosis leptorrhynchoides TaxID=125765 RepID=UPI003A99B1E8